MDKQTFYQGSGQRILHLGADAEKRFQSAFHASAIGMALVDLDGRFLLLNQSFSRMFGYSPEEMMAMTLIDITHPDDLEESLSAYQKLLNSKAHEPYTIEKRHIHRSGHAIWGKLTVSLVKDENNLPLYCILQVQDITEAKKAEIALHNSEKHLRYILKHDPNAIAVFDQHLNYIAVSDRFLRDYGVNETDLLGKNHYEVFPEMPGRWREIHQRVLSGAVERNDDDYFERPDGSITYNRWECRPWYTAEGDIGGMIMYTEVTTERKLAEQQLKKTKRLLENAEMISSQGAWDWDLRLDKGTVSEKLVQDSRMPGLLPDQHEQGFV